jgi:CHASE2 domain-containing sensor protein
MKRGKKRVGDAEGPRRVVPLPAPATDVSRRRGKDILRDLFKGLFFIVLVLVVKVAVEHTAVGKHIHAASYEWLQRQLVADEVPVTVVDIGDLEPEEFNVNGLTGRATPREPLRKLIAAITEHQPAAIGIDIDFSPDESGYIHPSDPEFFQFCLDMRRQRGVPIFLGIRRKLGKPSAEWLGGDEYEELAANILIPRDGRRMLREVKVGGASGAGVPAQASRPSKALSAALADAYSHRAGDAARWFGPIREAVVGGLQRVGFVEGVSEKRLGPGLTVEEFLVDFSPLDSIEPIRTVNPVVLRDQSQRQRFHNKIVILGDASPDKATDTFNVPGHEQRTYSGALVHACAAYTLSKARLYEVTGKGRLGIDIIFLLSILLTITFIRLYYRKRTSVEVATHRLQGVFTVLVVVAAFLFGVVFVSATRVMWDDFFLALLALAYHPWIERHLGKMWRRLWTYLRRLFGGLLFQ